MAKKETFKINEVSSTFRPKTRWPHLAQEYRESGRGGGLRDYNEHTRHLMPHLRHRALGVKYGGA